MFPSKFVVGLALLLFYCLGACVTEDQGRPEVEGLKDTSEDYLLSVWGKPEQRSSKASETILVFKKVKASKNEPLSGKQLETLCDMELTFNSDRIVKKWRYLKCGKFVPRESD